MNLRRELESYLIEGGNCNGKSVLWRVRMGCQCFSDCSIRGRVKMLYHRQDGEVIPLIAVLPTGLMLVNRSMWRVVSSRARNIIDRFVWDNSEATNEIFLYKNIAYDVMKIKHKDYELKVTKGDTRGASWETLLQRTTALNN